MFFLHFMLFTTFLEQKFIIYYFLGNIEKFPFTYWLNGRWFHQLVDIGNFNMKLNGKWFPQIVDHEIGTVEIYIQYINKKIVVLASDPVGGRSRATELPCFKVHLIICENIFCN